jgi:hypothetical protein
MFVVSQFGITGVKLIEFRIIFVVGKRFHIRALKLNQHQP